VSSRQQQLKSVPDSEMVSGSRTTMPSSDAVGFSSMP
jgi:hypothetical protein